MDTCLRVFVASHRDGYYDGPYDAADPVLLPSKSSVHVYRARVYCGAAGTYKWRTASTLPQLHNLRGAFVATGQPLAPRWHGKLRVHATDPRYAMPS
jgi:hypothetical protein